MQLELHTRRFFCPNPECLRKIFTERIPSVAAPSAHRTLRLTDVFTLIGFALKGKAGKRLVQGMELIASPDAWVQTIHGRTYARRVKSDGRVRVDEIDYSVKQALAGQSVILRVNATERSLEVHQQEKVVKVLPIKGLQGKRMPLDDSITLMQELARSSERQRLIKLHQRLIQAR